MSEFVLQVVNDRSLSVQNASDVNLTLRSAGTFSDGNFNTSETYNNYTCMDLSGMTAPLIFFRPMSSSSRIACIPGGPMIIGSGTTRQAATILKWYNLSIGTVQYYIFDQWTPPERGDYGIQAFNSGGGIIFDSSWYFMKVKGIYWMNPGFPNHANDPAGSNWTDLGQLGTGTIAVSMPNPRGWIYAGASTFGVTLMESIHLDGNNHAYVSLVPRYEFLDNAPGTGWAHANTISHVMTVDVSGLPTNYNPVGFFT